MEVDKKKTRTDEAWVRAAAVSSFTLCSFLEEPQAVNRLAARIIVANFTFLISMFFNLVLLLVTLIPGTKIADCTKRK